MRPPGLHGIQGKVPDAIPAGYPFQPDDATAQTEVSHSLCAAINNIHYYLPNIKAMQTGNK